MNEMILTALESIMIVTALSMDAFVASFAYGTNKVKIPFSSVTAINVICSSILAVSLFFGSMVSNFIPQTMTHLICFLILFVLGLMKLGESIVPPILGKNEKNKNEGSEENWPSRNIKFSFMGIYFDINMKSQEEKNDPNPTGKVLRLKEAASLSIALSLDGLAVGFGAALANANSVQIVAFSLISDMLAVMLGCFIGNRIAEKISFNLSWLSGIMLMILAFLKLS